MKGINSFTREGGDQFLVHSQLQSTGYYPSTLLAKLSASDVYESSGGFDIYVDFINTSSNPGFARVSILGD